MSKDNLYSTERHVTAAELMSEDISCRWMDERLAKHPEERHGVGHERTAYCKAVEETAGEIKTDPKIKFDTYILVPDLPNK